jgi:hypothetical protein
MKPLFLFVFLGIGIRIIDAIPLLNYLDYDYDISCNSVKNYYTSAIIVNHSIQNNTVTNNTVCHSKNSTKHYNSNSSKSDNSDYLKKGEKNNTFHGSVILEYKTLAYCHYICKMNVIANQENSNFISKYFDTYFQIGGVLHMICNNTICNWGNLICNGEKIKDEL